MILSFAVSWSAAGVGWAHTGGGGASWLPPAFQDEPGNSAVQMEEDVKVLMKADPSRQELLQSEVVPDPMEGEQTWPTEEELKEAEGQ